ncbi:hypothetical protein AAE478_009820 [Parahypoxylon ruwenzoriense]
MSDSFWITVIKYGIIFIVLRVLLMKIAANCFITTEHAYSITSYSTTYPNRQGNAPAPQRGRPDIEAARHFVQEQRGISSFQALGSARHNLQDRLEARAAPNRRLFEAFGIVNSFTTTDPEIHMRFLHAANGLIRNADGDWFLFSKAADMALGRTLTHFKVASPGVGVPLARVTRVFVFMTMLDMLFEPVVDPETLNIEDATLATEAINRLWVQSKAPERGEERDDPSWQLDQEQLEGALKRLLPDSFPCEPHTHPLNLIMPAYETMWRVCLLTFVSAGFRATCRKTTRMFRDVVDSVPRCFGQGNNEEDTALAFAKASPPEEALRLYPPTRRIYRAAQNAGASQATVESNDVEKCHRDPNIWGADALRFDPTRFGATTAAGRVRGPALTAEQKLAYMPFGTTPHVCPASAAFGYRAIIALAAALARRLGTREKGAKVLLLGNEELMWDKGRLLPSGRQDMEKWVLRMKRPT